MRLHRKRVRDVDLDKFDFSELCKSDFSSGDTFRSCVINEENTSILMLAGTSDYYSRPDAGPPAYVFFHEGKRYTLGFSFKRSEKYAYYYFYKVSVLYPRDGFIPKDIKELICEYFAVLENKTVTFEDL